MPLRPWRATVGIWVFGLLSLSASLSSAQIAPPRDAPALLARAEELEGSDPEQALALAEEARKLAPDERAQLTADAWVARLQRLLTNYPAAVELSERGLDRATVLDDRTLMARFRYVLARSQWSLGNYPLAMEHYLATLRLADEIGDQGLAFDCHSGVSTIFSDFKQPEQAQFHLEQARLIAEKLGDKVRLGDLHKILGNNAYNRGDLPRAREEHERSLKIHTEAHSERGIADALQNLGYTNEHLGELALAHKQTDESIQIYLRLGLRRHRVNAMRQLGRIFVKEGNPAAGVKELEDALALAQSLKSRTAIAYSYRELARAYESQGNLAAALQAQQKLLAANEAVFSERSSQQLAILNSRYITERRQLEVDLLRRDQALKDAELARSRAQRYWLGAIGGLGAIALAAIISRQRLKLKVERRIAAESRAAKEAAEKADAFKTRLLGIASHDLKNPLAAIMGGLIELRESIPLEKPFIEELLGEGQRMSELIRDLLDHAALESGQLKLTRAHVDVTALVTQAVAAQQHRARAKAITLTLENDSPVHAEINGDAVRLRQVFTNLIDNALKFTPPAGAVQVKLHVTPEAVSTSITDTGPGLPSSDLPKLFSPFAVLSARPTAGESSTGLGLSICHELVSLHRGQLIVQSAPGAGSTFTVVLPRGGSNAPMPLAAT